MTKQFLTSPLIVATAVFLVFLLYTGVMNICFQQFLLQLPLSTRLLISLLKTRLQSFLKQVILCLSCPGNAKLFVECFLIYASAMESHRACRKRILLKTNIKDSLALPSSTNLKVYHDFV